MARKTLWEKRLERATALIDRIKKGEPFEGVDMDSLVDKQMVKESLARMKDANEVDEYTITVDEAYNLLMRLE